MNCTIYGVLWDMDGVLVDTGDFHYQAWKQVLPEFGLELNRDLFNRLFGMNNAGIAEVLLGHPPEDGFVDRLSARKEGLFREIVRGQVQPLPGVRGWIEWLDRQDGSRSYRQAVASSAPQENIDLLIEEMGLGAYFDALVSAYAMPGKPDPAVFLEAARRIGVVPQHCVVIEDGLPGVEAARRAGMRCIAVTTTNPRNALEQAELVVDSLEELAASDFVTIFS